MEKIYINGKEIPDAKICVAAPKLLVALKNLHDDVASGALDSESLRVAGDLIEELEGC